MGLKAAIARDVRMAKVKEYAEVIEMVMISERALAGVQKENELKRSHFTSKAGHWKSGGTDKGKQKQENPQKRLRQDQTDSMKYEKPVCNNYGKNHWGECRIGSNKCFKCRKPGHMAKDCNNVTATRSGQKGVQGRVFEMTTEEADMDPSVVTGNIFIDGIIASVLFDSGSTHSFASPAFAMKLGQIPEKLSTKYSVSIPSDESVGI
ncbi:hypothetical protein TIFTF001_026053 [Ficus carica]|uniref:CCHC-type domain-containing protein n=1 Tax=Ficus carica TaxID=3494 RepID=A0AA88DHH0_FICCA|nr:hypothetical protein TIFTF001_026053 [Ficus carica]